MKTIDCLIIGHYETGTTELYNQLSKQGVNSGSYKDFNLGFVSDQLGRRLSLTDLYNTLVEDENKRIREANTFNAAISYIGSYLNKRNITFEYITSVREELPRLEEILANNQILSVAILTTLYVIPNPIIEVVRIVREFCPSTKIVVGGPFVTTLCRTKDDDYVKYVCNDLINADYYVNSSKGEKALENLILALKHNSDVSMIDNLFYVKNDEVIKNKVSSENQSLAENPVNWGLFASDQKEFVNVRTAVSCPYTCAFCGFPENAGKYQTSDVAFVEKELNELVQSNPRLKSIYFIDDTFNVPKARFKEILHMMIKNKYEFKWHSYLRCQHVDEETIQLMSESGCEGVFLGIESGSNVILSNMNKQAKVEHYEKGIEMLKKVGIMTFGAFIIGFPGENLKTVMETIRFIENSGLDFFRAQMWFCERITPIWKQRELYGIEGEGFDWTHKTMNSKTAASFVDKMFLDVKNVTWLPQHDFDYENVFRLLHSGMTADGVKALVRMFNNCIKLKLRQPGHFDVSDEDVVKMSSLINSYGNVLIS
jgi:anaerobic magnesium-protoporphyrin IX monomethyl ester cyclase